MAFTAAAGKTGSVLVGTVSYAFKEWSINMEEKLVEVSNFVTGAYRFYAGALTGATLDLTGPYDVGPAGSGGNMALVTGNTYSFTLNVNGTVSLVVSAIVNKVSLTQNIDDVAQVKVSATIQGSFVASLA